MAAHEQNLVHSVKASIGIKRVDDLCESLPLGSVAACARIGLVHQAKVEGGLR